MEKMKPGINVMGTEGDSHWQDTHKLQDAMKELEDGAFEGGWHVLEAQQILRKALQR